MKSEVKTAFCALSNPIKLWHTNGSRSRIN